MNLQVKKITLYLIFFSILFILSCQSDKDCIRTKNRNNPETAKYHATIRINFTFTGKGEVSKDKKIIINLDKTEHGHIIATRYLYTKNGAVEFAGIPVNLKYLYLDLAYDRDASGGHSDGDSFSFYKDENENPIAIDISKSEVELNITLDDNNIWGNKDEGY